MSVLFIPFRTQLPIWNRKHQLIRGIRSKDEPLERELERQIILAAESRKNAGGSSAGEKFLTLSVPLFTQSVAEQRIK